PQQHGFTPCKSTKYSLLGSLNDWYQCMNTINVWIPMDVFYFDISKAFDTCCPELSVKNLETAGISPNSLRWLHNYLTNHRFKVKIYFYISDIKNILIGNK